MIRIEVLTDKVNSKQVTAKVGGKQYTFREQEGYAFIPDKDGVLPRYPTKITLRLEDEQPGYAPGFYTLSPASFYVADFGALAIGRVTLVKQVAAASKAA